jgi:ADP-ribosylation factor 1/2
MGFYISKLYDLMSQWSDGTPSRILLLGLDGAGKTTLLYKVKLNENVMSIPTIGFNVETVTPIRGISFTVWDVGGQYKIRQLWRHYYENSSGLFFVVDSTDGERMEEAAGELHSICQDDNMRGVPVVIIANKQDLPTALSPSQLIQKLGLEKLAQTNNKWYIQSACAINGDGIFESMKTMSDMVKEFKKQKNNRF